MFFKDGFLAYPIIKLPNTVPIPDPVKSQIYAFNIAQKKIHNCDRVLLSDQDAWAIMPCWYKTIEEDSEEDKIV